MTKNYFICLCTFHLKLGMHISAHFCPNIWLISGWISFLWPLLSVHCASKSKGQLSHPRQPLGRQINFWHVRNFGWPTHLTLCDTTLIADMMIATEQQRTLALLTLAIVVANVASLPSFLSANWTSHAVQVCHAFWESIWAGVSAFRGFGKQSDTNVCRASIAASNKPASELSHEFLLTAVMTDSCQSSNQTAGAMGLFYT